MNRIPTLSRQRGEKRAEELYRRFTPVLSAYLARRWGDVLSKAERDEVVQDVWTTYYESDAGGRQGGSPEGFLVQTAKNRASTRARNAKRRRTSAVDPQSPTLARVAGGDTEEEALNDLDEKELRGFADKLTGRDRDVFLGRFVLGMERADLQAATGMTASHAGKVNARLAGRLREHFCSLRIPALADAQERLREAVDAGEVNNHQLMAARNLAEATEDPGLRKALEQFDGYQHALGLAVPAAVAAEGLGSSSIGLLGHFVEAADRARDGALSLIGRGGESAADAGAGSALAGGASGAGVAGGGGAVAVGGGKLVAGLCAGAATTACVAAGVVPGVGLKDAQDPDEGARHAAERVEEIGQRADVARLSSLAEPVEAEQPEPAPADPAPEPEAELEPEGAAAPEPEPEPAGPVASPVAQEFEPIGTPVGGSSSSSSSSPSRSSGGSGGSAGSDFGP